MGAAGGEDLESAVSADNSVHERGALGIRPLNGGDGSVGEDDTKHSRRTRDGMQSIHGDSVSSAAVLAHRRRCRHCCRLLLGLHWLPAALVEPAACASHFKLPAALSH